jgi:hypothetical protein
MVSILTMKIKQEIEKNYFFIIAFLNLLLTLLLNLKNANRHHYPFTRIIA